MKYLIFLGLFALASAQCAPKCSQGFTYYNGSCYITTSGYEIQPNGVRNRLDGMPWTQANNYCKMLNPNAHLVVLNNEAEHSFIYEWACPFEPVEMWIGLFFNVTATQYQWVNGEPVTYTGFEPFYRPERTFEHCATIFQSEFFTRLITQRHGYRREVSPFWLEERRSEEFPFICEYELPTTPTVDQGNGTNTNQTNSTTPFPTTRNPFQPTMNPFGPTAPFNPNPNPPVFRPQIMHRQNPGPARLSSNSYNWFNGLQMRYIGERNMQGPAAYRRNGQFGARPRQYAMP